jgi:hypothetical protein
MLKTLGFKIPVILAKQVTHLMDAGLVISKTQIEFQPGSIS